MPNLPGFVPVRWAPGDEMAAKKKKQKAYRAPNQHRPMYGVNENQKECRCGSVRSKIKGTYKAGVFFCRRRCCDDCGQYRITKEPLNQHQAAPEEPAQPELE